MDITSTPNLKPFRDYSDHDVINQYAHVDGSVNKGTWVTITAANGNTNVSQNAGTAHLGYTSALSSNTPSRATVLRSEVSWKIDSASAGDVVLGVLLYDVRETNSWGESYVYQPKYERSEQQVIVSGEAAPVLTDGIILLNGFAGTAGAGSGATIGTGAAAGTLVVADYTNAVGNVGKFLSSVDADGYAFFKVEC